MVGQQRDAAWFATVHKSLDNYHNILTVLLSYPYS